MQPDRLRIWDLAFKERDRATLERLARCRIGWRYVDDQLQAIPPDPCP